jgi:hypothetical protein
MVNARANSSTARRDTRTASTAASCRRAVERAYAGTWAVRSVNVERGRGAAADGG